MNNIKILSYSIMLSLYNFAKLPQQFYFMLSQSPTQIVEEQTQQIIQATTSTHIDTNVLQMYNALQNSVDTMDKKVQIVMKKHQSEFLYAYRTHIKKIKKQLQQIKKKSQEQQKMFSANDRIRYLEKQIAVFRQQAIKLYDKLDKKTYEFALLKQKIEGFQNSALHHQNQNKELMLKIKKLQASENDYQRVILTLQKKVEEQDQKIKQYQKKLHSRELHKSFMESIKGNIGSKMGNPEKSLPNSPTKQIKIYRNQLQQWFLECVKSVKKEIHQRKNSFQTLDLNRIKSISEFKLVDKLRLFQLLLENEKLINWLYHKIFPDGMDKISMHLQQVKTSRQGNSSQGPLISSRGQATSHNSARVSSQNRYRQEQLILPRMQQPLKNQSMVRNRISMRNGKMNLSLI